MSGAAPERVVHPALDALYDDAVERIAVAAEAALRERGRFAVVLTGGSTVPPIYERLATVRLRQRIVWEATEVSWTDERCVPPADPDSNYRMVKEALLDRVRVPRERIHRMRGEDPNPERAALEHEHRIQKVMGLAPGEAPRFDFLLLGLGADAHVASLFPGHPLIRASDRLVGAVDAGAFAVPPPGHDRLTLTPPALNGAREAVFVVTGATKAPAVRKVLADPRDPDRLPAQLVAPSRGTVTWLLDTAAAGAS